MTIVRKSLLQFIFSGAYLLRWNDKLRPVELLEIDKQAHKMLIACILWHENSKNISESQKISLANEIIEGCLFDYFYRLIITDIKPPVFYKIKENTDHFNQLTNYVLNKLEPILSPLGPFWSRMVKWHHNYNNNSLSKKILEASHLYASRWEFNLLKNLNSFDEEINSIAESFETKLSEFGDLKGMNYILEKNTALASFANLCGQLRFQIRWTQAPRIPATSVLGHMFIVASIAYFFSLSLNCCTARANNNFFCGLFHDLPELLTRDIISPVKQSVQNLPLIIKEYEEKELESRIFNRLRKEHFSELVDRISYYLGLEVGSEFQECYKQNNKIIKIDTFKILHNNFNKDEFDPKDGQMIKICDWLAAYLEAHSSIKNGISSPHLQEAMARLKEKLCDNPFDCLNIEALLADFD